MSTIKVNTIQTTTGQEVYAAKAWVNFDGTNAGSINAAGNISSITDNGTGNYTINFTNAMNDTNYCVVSGYELNSGLSSPMARTIAIENSGRSTTSVTIRTGYYTTANFNEDQPSVHVAIFR